MHDGRVTSPWAAPAAVLARTSPAVRADAAAAALTGVVVVLLGAPVGLLWAAVAPRVEVVLRGAEGPGLVDPETSAFAGADIAFGALAVVVGLLCGLGAYALARRYGPGVVAGLLLGGLLAAYVAAKTGTQVGKDGFQAAARDLDRTGTVEANVRLRAYEALVLWPAAALAAFAGATAAGGSDPDTEAEPSRAGVSSG
ncbi:MAG: hypothetical protein JWM64_1795 [Frankiales bacterium]|nr:hypothetical protein [Frankiales bacterium]